MHERTDQGGREPSDGRYGVYETDDGRIVIYDEINPDAYLRSDEVVELVR